MNLLTINTASNICSVSSFMNGKVLFFKRDSGKIVPVVSKKLNKKAKLKIQRILDLKHIANIRILVCCIYLMKLRLKVAILFLPITVRVFYLILKTPLIV